MSTLARAVVVLLGCLIAGCTTASGAGGSATPDPAADTGPTEISTAEVDRGNAVSGGTAGMYILREDELPDGWRYATGQQYLAIPELCDVVLEPPALASAKTQRFTRGYSGPFVIQYSFVSDDEDATTARIAEAVTAASACTTWDIDAETTVTVTPLEDIPAVGEAFLAVRLQAEGGSAADVELVVFRNGPAVTVLQSYSPADLAAHTDVAAMASAIDRAQESSHGAR